MEPLPPDADQGPGLPRANLLRKAVEVYLGIAYPAGGIPEVVRRRVALIEEPSEENFLARPPFERAGKAPGSDIPIYALRLGNSRYPNMKMQIQAWNNEAGFMLSVNTHDQIAGLDLVEDAERFRELQKENQHLKEAIERAWDETELPTFLTYLREYIQSQAPGRRGDDPGGAGADPESSPRE